MGANHRPHRQIRLGLRTQERSTLVNPILLFLLATYAWAATLTLTTAAFITLGIAIYTKTRTPKPWPPPNKPKN